MSSWQNDLCDCFNDCGICCYGYWCMPCLYGENAEKIDGSSCFAFCCLYCLTQQIGLCCIPHMFTRASLRNKFGLAEEPCNDCCVTACCPACAICQEAREIKSRENKAVQLYYTAITAQPVPNMGDVHRVDPEKKLIETSYFPKSQQP